MTALYNSKMLRLLEGAGLGAGVGQEESGAGQYIKMISGLAREVCAGRDSVCCSWRCSMSAAQRTSFLEAAAERLSYASQTALGTLP